MTALIRLARQVKTFDLITSMFAFSRTAVADDLSQLDPKITSACGKLVK